MSTDKTLETQRLSAAIASCGTSTNSIYIAFEKVLKQLNVEGDLLDFGAGTGILTQRLQALGHFRSITAIDIMQRPPEMNDSIKWISWDLNYVTNMPDQSVDIIVSAEVIEHLENPRAVVREWFRLLRPNGTLIFSTPNNESWRSFIALLLRGHFADFSDVHYPAHITALLRKDIERSLEANDFAKPKFIFTNDGSLPKLTRVRWQAISGGLFRGLRYSDNLLSITKKPVS